MKCDKCGITITSGDKRAHQNSTFCEDCYMVALSPIKTCDPWAVHSAKNFEKFAGDTKQLTQAQSAILQILKTDGPMEPETLLKRFGHNMELADLQREFSTLRQYGKGQRRKTGSESPVAVMVMEGFNAKRTCFR